MYNITVNNHQIHLGSNLHVSYPIEEYGTYPRSELSDRITKMIMITNFENFSTLGEFQQIMSKIYTMDDGIVDRFLNSGNPPQKMIVYAFVAHMARALRESIVRQSKHRREVEELAPLILRYETRLIDEKKAIEIRFRLSHNQPAIEDV